MSTFFDTRTHTNGQRGFSLVEMIVAVALFSIIMLVAISTLLSLVNASRKARTLESMMNNLNISLDSMVRATRMGSRYNCGSEDLPNSLTGADCTQGLDPNTQEVIFSFAPFESDSCNAAERAVYYLEDGALKRSLNGGETKTAVTAPDVLIDEMQFYTIGSRPGDTVQPKVVVVVKGTAGDDDVRSRTTFNIQATAVQRELDIEYGACN